MTYFSYISDQFPIQQWTYNFNIWSDLMTNNYEFYANPYSESRENAMNGSGLLFMDETYSKYFLRHLYQMMDDIDTGKVKTIPADDVLKRL